jgi:glycosyltransferase involved in cell wall biosynthesis
VRIYCDLQAMQNPANSDRGIARYVNEFARAVEENHPGVVEGWLLNPELPTPTQTVPLMYGGAVRSQDDPDLRSPDVWHVLSPFEELGQIPLERMWPRWARSSRTRLFVTLYDLIPLIYADRYLGNPLLRRNYMARLRLVEGADRVLAISQATARDAVRLLGIPAHRVDVVGTGVSEHFVPTDDRDGVLRLLRQELPSLRPGYLLYTGGIDFRKNIEGLVNAYARLPQAMRADHQLVIVCRVQPSEREHLEQRARALGVAEDFLLTGYVPDDVLLRVYQAAHLFVFPSLYEGFGLPVVEALSCGVPAIVGRNSSLTELVDDPNAWFDAAIVDDITRAMFRALSDDSFRATLVRSARDHDYRWNVVAERSLAAYARSLRGRTARVERPRVALVSPMPPARSGVADYSRKLLDELAVGASVDVFTSVDAYRPKVAGVTWHSYGEMPAALRLRGAYDEIVYAMGNSDHHVEVFSLLQRYGGTVIAHDVRYTGFFGVLEAQRPELLDDRSADTLRHLRAGQLPPRFQHHERLDIGRYYQTNDLLCAPIAEHADTVFVHSTTAATLARLNVPTEDRGKVQLLPFGHSLRPELRGGVRDTIASFGIVDRSKRSEDVVAAFIQLAEADPDLKFALVGDCFDQQLWTELHETVTEAGLGDRITLAGRVDEDTYRHWLSRARLGVQLRAHSNGESSAAVADCMGAGVPTMVSRIGSMAELGDACLQLPGTATVDDLVRVISGLLADDRRLTALGERAFRYAEEHSFASAAAQLLARAAARRDERVGSASESLVPVR